MPLPCVRVLVASTVAALVASTVLAVGAPASAEPAAGSSLPAPTVAPTGVHAGTDAVVSGRGCVDGSGHGTEVSVLLDDTDGRVLAVRNTSSGEDGSWRLTITVPVNAPASAVAQASCGDPGAGPELYPAVPVGIAASAAAPWQAETPALPAVPNGSLVDVSCPSAGWCVAVGSYGRAGVPAPLVEVFDGSWRVVDLTPPDGSRGSSLAAVSCTSTTSCTAVGTTKGATGDQGLTVVLSKGGWRQVMLPLPPAHLQVSLADVSCPSASFCLAVGSIGDPATLSASPVAYALTGGTWRATSPVPVSSAAFSGVSCRSATSCLAVGGNGGGSGGMAQVLRGTAWAVAPISAPHVVPAAVTCFPGGRCTVVGRVASGTTAEPDRPWVGKLDLTARRAAVSGAPLTGVGTGGLDALSCVTGNACTAVGRTGYATSPGASYVLEEVAGAWSVSPSPSAAVLRGVTCVTGPRCTVVGDRAGTPVAFRGDGRRFANDHAAAPVGLPSGRFDGVVCSGPLTCTAVGRYTDAVGVTRPLVDRRDAGGWSLQTLPDVPGGELTGVACPSTTSCVAVGHVVSTNGPDQPLVLQWSGASGWHLVDTSAFGGSGSVTAVSCSAVGACLAVGQGSPLGPLVLSLADGAWSLVPPPPLGNLQAPELPAVSCVSTTCHTAVNGAPGGETTTASVRVQWNGTSWAEEAPAFVQITGVSCTPAAGCLETVMHGSAAAVRRSTDPASTTRPLPYNGTTIPSGVSCRDALQCVAVGLTDGGQYIVRSSAQGWRIEPVAADVPHVAGLTAVSCLPHGGRCVAVGGGDGPPLIVTDDGNG